ncbi:hypothetical protein DPMN_090693 [Dreissena polymorpha]|uniref:Uncharacterized protein n=1 Tax=Dreissena polymorpha TaxID=45954 RepID=A0A9D4KY73_DREPO|nr:hypothetical protein DPMN_090693 [Dreissena polymorpha]
MQYITVLLNGKLETQSASTLVRTRHRDKGKCLDIIGRNLLTKVLTRKNAPPPGSHVFKPTGIIFEYFQDIIRMNLLTKFHEDRTVNVASRVLTRFYYSRIRKIAPPLRSHLFQANIIIFELIQDIIETNLLTKFHEDWTINVASRVLTRKNARPWWPYIIGTNLQTKFHDDRKINVTSRVLTSGHKTHVLTKFHEDWTKNVTSRVFTCFHYIHKEKTAPPPWRPYINETNVLTKFHDGWAKIVTSRPYKETAPPPGGHVFQRTGTIFELNQHII